MAFGLVYGREGANFPDVAEVGPFYSETSALEAVDESRFDRLGGVMIVRDWSRSDGRDISTGAGVVLAVASRCQAPDDEGEDLCGAPAFEERTVEGVVVHLCADHARELDDDPDGKHN